MICTVHCWHSFISIFNIHLSSYLSIDFQVNGFKVECAFELTERVETPVGSWQVGPRRIEWVGTVNWGSWGHGGGSRPRTVSLHSDGAGFDPSPVLLGLTQPTPPTFHVWLIGFVQLINTSAAINSTTKAFHAVCTYLCTGIYNSDPTLLLHALTLLPVWEFNTRACQRRHGGFDRFFSFCLHFTAFIDEPSQCGTIIYWWLCTLPWSHVCIASLPSCLVLTRKGNKQQRQTQQPYVGILLIGESKVN